MWFTNLAYNPRTDLKPVEPFGFIDLKDALANSAVPSQLPDSDTDYNGIENPESILGKPTDVFDAMSMERSINDFVPPASAERDENQ